MARTVPLSPPWSRPSLCRVARKLSLRRPRRPTPPTLTGPRLSPRPRRSPGRPRRRRTRICSIPTRPQQVYRADGVCPSGARHRRWNRRSRPGHDGGVAHHVRRTSPTVSTASTSARPVCSPPPADGPGLTVLHRHAEPDQHDRRRADGARQGRHRHGRRRREQRGRRLGRRLEHAARGCGRAPAPPAGLGSTWDTTGYANGVFEVCNVVVDAAGHTAIAWTTVTVSTRAPARPRHAGADRG